MSSGAEDEQYGAQRLRPFLRITRFPYEEPYHLNLLVAASNGRLRGEIEIYANADDLGVVAARIRRAPETDRSPVWELGSERSEDRFAFYFCLRVVRQSPSGACALALRFNNNAQDADRELTDFSIPVFPADLDRLASLLERFRSLEHRLLWWTPVDGELLREDAARYDAHGA
jgi:hypothetical protein